MIDPWEVMQKGYQRTLTVLSTIRNSLCRDGLADQDSLKVMLLCGSDLLESFSTPGIWIPDQFRTICRDFGVICIRREGKDVGNSAKASSSGQPSSSQESPPHEFPPQPEGEYEMETGAQPMQRKHECRV